MLSVSARSTFGVRPRRRAHGVPREFPFVISRLTIGSRLTRSGKSFFDPTTLVPQKVFEESSQISKAFHRRCQPLGQQDVCQHAGSQ
ncbi:hypothetical protein X801_07932, partial [Opisthorchis viverrini]